MKIKHILVPVDFSDRSGALSSEVEWLATHFQARVTLLHVFEVPTSWYGFADMPLLRADEFQAYAAKERERLEAFLVNLPPASVERVSEEGNPALFITDWAKHHDVDLVVMGTHGYGPVRRLLLGSVAMKVLHDVNCPVWIRPALTAVPCPENRAIGNIVCSLELTDEAVPVLQFARETAQEFGALVRLVHCVPDTMARPPKYLDGGLHAALKQWAVDEIATLQTKAGTNFPLTITEGQIAHDIAEVANDQKADVVIIGRGACQATLGTWRTHAYDIIRQAPCPVLSYSCKLQTHETPAVEHETHEQLVG